MPNTPRRVSSGDIEYRRKGRIKGWETVEICTNDPTEIGRYLKGFDPRTRVWISASGTVYQYQGQRRINRGEQAHVSLTANVEYRMVTSDRVEQQIARNMAVFRNPNTNEFDIEQFCVRTKEPL